MTSDEDLMRGFQEGRRDAFDALFERYRRPVWAFFRRRVADPERAAELAQDVFVAILQGTDRYAPRGAFRSYVFGIAFNLLSAWRRSTNTPAFADVEPADIAAATPDLAAVLSVRRALAELEDAEREIVMLREFDALSYEEIAASLGIPLNTVRSRLFRARMALKARLEGTPAHRGDHS